MKKILIFYMAALMLVGCGGNKPSASAETDTDDDSINVDSVVAEVMPQYDITDALSMGLNAHVQHVSMQCYETYESNGELKDGCLNIQYEMSFDANGRMTTDEWGNEYGYDAEGKYYRGNHIYTTIKRDKEGRIVTYNDVEPKKDHEDEFVQSFHYDKNGRLVVIEYEGGFSAAWTEKRHYNSGNLYPVKKEQAVSYEGGGGSEVIVTYRYTSFDNQNNWTERLCMVSTKEIVEEPVDSFIPEQPKINEKILVEKRTITYYE